MRRIAIVNQKGGTGKTTTAGNLGVGLSMREKKVLLVDFDPQGALSIWFDVNSDRNLFDLMSGRSSPDRCIYKLRENLFLLPGDRRLSRIQAKFDTSWWDQIVSRESVEPGPFDYVMMDCPPSWSILSRFAVTVAGEVFLPVSMDYLSMIGIRQVIEGVGDIVDENGAAPDIELVVPTLYDRRQKKSREILKVLRWHFGRRVTEPIRVNVSLSEAISYHQSIFEYAPESHGASDYEKLVRRVEHVEESESDGGRSLREGPGSSEGAGEQEEIFE
jgi:chromosome partitioning protein